MAKETISRLGADHRTNLVAYLDGELEDRASQEVEQVLASSPVARHEVEMLARTWDMLNLLPTRRASGMFSQHTMQKLQQADLKAPPLTERPWYRPVRRSLIFCVWAAGLAAAGALGFQATYRWFPNDTNVLVDNLPIVKELDAYEAAGDLEFLKLLRDSPVYKQLKDKVESADSPPPINPDNKESLRHAPPAKDIRPSR